MNYYGTDEHKRQMEELDKGIFSKLSLEAADREKVLENGYVIKFYVADNDHQMGCTPENAEVCRLYRDNELIFEWKKIYGKSLMAKIIHHSDGNEYFVFNEDLYGYSVLDLNTMECMHYMPAQSYKENSEEFEETFIWCDCFYNPEMNLLAVEGCYWACPYSLIVVDFSNPLIPVEVEDWLDVLNKMVELDLDTPHISFEKWDGNKLFGKGLDEGNVKFSLDDRVEVVLT